MHLLTTGAVVFRTLEENVDVLYKRSKTDPVGDSRALCAVRFLRTGSFKLSLGVVAMFEYCVVQRFCSE